MASGKTDGPIRGLRGIAILAGVSPATVSRVINNRPGVRPELRQTVEQIIKEHGLQVDVAARALKTRKTHILAIIIPRSGQMVFMNPYFTEILRGLSTVTEQADYSLAVTTGATPQTLYEVNRNRSCDAVLFIGFRRNIPDAQSLKGAAVPVVTIPRPAPRYKLPYVSMDDEKGAYSATHYLIEKGHSRIALLVGSSSSVFTNSRLPGYRRALADAGLPFLPSLVVDGQFTYEGALEASRLLLEKKPRPTAILALSDLMAVGAMSTLRELDISVPADMALIGFGNSPICSYVTPTLTTVDEQIYEMGVQAGRLLIALAEGEHPAVDQIEMPTRLVIRESA